MKRLIYILIVVIFFGNNSIAQEKDSIFDLKNYRTSFSFKTVKQGDNSRLVEAEFLAKNKKDRKDKLPIYDAEIKFYNDETLLGSAKTSKDGIASLIVPKGHTYVTNEEGNITLKAVFEGTDGLDEEEDEVTIKDIFLKLDLQEIDSVKTVKVNAYSIDSLGTEQPVEEATVGFFIQGMLSKMKIEEGDISDGEYEFEMLTKVPGDTIGNITIYAMIHDSDEYGNVSQNQTINWGAGQVNDDTSGNGNKLWSEAAPIWMYVVLTILLLGVWINYLYTIIHLFEIKKEGKELEITM